MNRYWKEHYDSNAQLFSDSPLRQVDRTVNGQEIAQDQIDLTAEAVLRNLTLSSADTVADLCCGNGLITEIIAAAAGNVIAVDFSERLIAHAIASNRSPNVNYVASDVTTLTSAFLSPANKFYMRDSVACLSSDDLLGLLHAIAAVPRFEAFFVAGVPDADKLEVYYDNDEKLAFYHRRQAEGKPHIGTWWRHGEIDALAAQAGLRVRHIAQDPLLVCAYYRYDCLFEPARAA